MTGDLRVLAIDAALRTSGWARPDGTTTVKHGADPDQPATRLLDHHLALRTELRRQLPDVVAFEGYAYSIRQASSLVSLGELGGALKLACLAEGVQVIAVPPSSVKLYALGKGGGKGTGKDQMVQAARDYLYAPNLVGQGAGDRADALWLWAMVHHRYVGALPRRFTASWSADDGSRFYQRRHGRIDEALAGVAWPTLHTRKDRP